MPDHSISQKKKVAQAVTMVVSILLSRLGFRLLTIWVNGRKKSGSSNHQVWMARNIFLDFIRKYTVNEELDRKKYIPVIKGAITPVIRGQVKRNVGNDLYRLFYYAVLIYLFIVFPPFFLGISGYPATGISLVHVRWLTFGFGFLINSWVIFDWTSYLLLLIQVIRKKTMMSKNMINWITVAGNFRIFTFRITLGLFVCLVIIAFTLHKPIGEHPGRILATTALLTAMLITIASRLMSFLYSSIGSLQMMIHRRFHAEGLIYYHLLILFGLLEYDRRYFSAWQIRKMLIMYIDNLAEQFEKIMPPQLLGKDLASNGLIQQRISRISAAIRQSKMELAFPDGEEWKKKAAASYASFLVKFASNKWSELPQSDLQKVTGYSFRQRATRAFRSILAGVFPLAVLLAVQHFYTPLSPDKWQYALLLCILWLVTSLITMLDPKAEAKFSMLKDAKELAGGVF